jgi:hypothetical protein
MILVLFSSIAVMTFQFVIVLVKIKLVRTKVLV